MKVTWKKGFRRLAAVGVWVLILLSFRKLGLIGFDWVCFGILLALIGFDWLCIGFELGLFSGAAKMPFLS